jgi:FdrA protein
MEKSKLVELLNSPLHVINVGLEEFADQLEAQGVSVLQVDWSPPAGGDPELADLLSKLGA